jgi:hypothetical protein
MRDVYIESIYHYASLINSETNYLPIENNDATSEVFLGGQAGTSWGSFKWARTLGLISATIAE